MKLDWFKQLKRVYCESVKVHWLFQWKLTDLIVKNIASTDESVERQITDSINKNLTDSDLERGHESEYFSYASRILFMTVNLEGTFTWWMFQVSIIHISYFLLILIEDEWQRWILDDRS